MKGEGAGTVSLGRAEKVASILTCVLLTGVFLVAGAGVARYLVAKDARVSVLAEAEMKAFATAQRLAPHLYEPLYNGALLAFKLGEFEKAHEMAARAHGVYPGHSDTQELLAQLKKHFSLL